MPSRPRMQSGKQPPSVQGRPLISGRTAETREQRTGQSVRLLFSSRRPGHQAPLGVKVSRAPRRTGWYIQGHTFAACEKDSILVAHGQGLTKKHAASTPSAWPSRTWQEGGGPAPEDSRGPQEDMDSAWRLVFPGRHRSEHHGPARTCLSAR